MEGKNILITGGCGFLGSNLAKRLIEKNKVSLFIRPGESRDNIKDFEDKLEVIEGDLTSKKDVSGALLETDYLYHFAWQTDLKKSMESPVDDLKNDLGGLINILEVCRTHNPNVKIVFTSTVTVADENSVYDINKLMAEKYFQMYYDLYGVKSCVLRLSNVFGEKQRIDNPNRGVLNFMIGRALQGEVLTVYGEGNWIRDYSYVQDYVDAFVSAAENEKTNGKVFVIGSGEGKTFNEVVENIKKIVEELTGKNVKIEHVEFPEGSHDINKRNFVADYMKFRYPTGWYPKTSFEEGLRKTIEFYLEK